jgi:hypothetical protein
LCRGTGAVGKPGRRDNAEWAERRFVTGLHLANNCGGKMVFDFANPGIADAAKPAASRRSERDFGLRVKSSSLSFHSLIQNGMFPAMMQVLMIKTANQIRRSARLWLGFSLFAGFEATVFYGLCRFFGTM